MKIKKIPMRTCVVTGEKYPKNELLRIVKTPEGNVLPDITGKLNGLMILAVRRLRSIKLDMNFKKR